MNQIFWAIELRYLMIAILTLLLTFFYLTILNDSSNDMLFVVYGTEHSMECSKLRKFLLERFNSNSVLFLNLLEDEVLTSFFEILNLLETHGLISYLCPTCIPRGYMIYEDPIPLTGVFNGGSLSSVILGFYSRSFWLRALNTTKNLNSSLLFMTPGFEAFIEDSEFINRLELFFLNGYFSRLKLETVPSLALTDSLKINIAVTYAMLILTMISLFDTKRAVSASILSSFVIFLCNLALGLGLTPTQALIYLRYLFAFIALVATSTRFMSILSKRLNLLNFNLKVHSFRHRVWHCLSYLIAILLGVTVSLILLPYHNRLWPYLMKVSLTSGYMGHT